MSDEERELTPSEPPDAPGPTDTPPVEPAEVPLSVAIEGPVSAPTAEAADAPPAPDADLEQDAVKVGGTVDESVDAIPPPPPPPPSPPLPPAIIEEATEITGDDKLLAALAWFTMVIFQLPILSIILLLIEPNRNRPFQRYHAVLSTAFWFVAVIYEVVAGLAVGVLTLVSFGIFAVCMCCLWVIFFLPHIVALVYAFYALTGKTPEMPVISKLAREQKWI